MQTNKLSYVWAVLRISIGFIFLWAFFDKLLGLGFATCADSKTGGYLGYMCSSAWFAGGSPTSGFLMFATKGIFAPLFKSLVGYSSVDWLYMAGLLGIGVSLLFGIFVRAGVISGIAMFILFYLAGFLPPVNNPFLDEHIVYAIVLVGVYFADEEQKLGLKNWLNKKFF